MADPETQTVTPEPGAAPDVPSVNPEAHPVADSESQGTDWVDPLFLERDEAVLPDEIVVAGSEEAAQAAAAETEDAAPSAEQLAKLIAEDTEAPGSDDPAGKPAQTAAKAKEEPAAKAKKGDDKDSGDAGSTADSETGSEAAGPTDDDGKLGEEVPIGDEVAAARRRRREEARVRRIRKLEQENAALQQRLGTLDQPAPAGEAEQAETQVPDEPPTLEDHEFDTEKWATAMGEWTKAQVGQAERTAAKAREEEAG